MNFNQHTIIGYIGKNAETKQLPNGTPVTKFSVATTRSWKDDKGEWKDKTKWHTVIAYGQSFMQVAPRLTKGAHVFVQGELTTREYDRTIQVPNGKKTIEHVIQQLAVELKADTIRLLDRTSNSGASEAAPAATNDDVPLRGDSSQNEYRAGRTALYPSHRHRPHRARAPFWARRRFSSGLTVAQ